MNGTVITVEGVFERRRPAERGLVRLAVAADGPDRVDVLQRVRALQASVTDGLRALHSPDGPVTTWSAERLQVWGERPWSQDGAQLPLVQHASATVEAEFADADRLADWVQTVAEDDGVTVADVSWTLTDATAARLRAEARDGAVRDAVGRATADAASLGLGALRAIALAEPGLLGDAPRSADPVDAMPMARMSASAASSPTVDLRPADITIAARVHARFIAE